MMTIAKIGKAALERLLKSARFNCTRLDFREESLLLDEPSDTSAKGYYASRYYGWSIEFGLREIEFEVRGASKVSESIRGGLEKLILRTDGVCPTHIIHRSSCSDPKYSWDHFLVYRLRQEQQKELQK